MKYNSECKENLFKQYLFFCEGQFWNICVIFDIVKLFVSSLF